MSQKEIPALSGMEIDMLQELLNISFGRAAAELAEIIDIFIHINNPQVEFIQAGSLAETMRSQITDFELSSLVEQHYHGDLQGVSLLVFPQGADRELLSYFQNYDSRVHEQESLIELDKEVLMEIGNILIGACLGNLFKLLNCTVRYLPPRNNTGSFLDDVFLNDSIDREQSVISMKTGFQFEDRNISGDLYIISHFNAVPRLRRSLKDFWGSYNVQ